MSRAMELLTAARSMEREMLDLLKKLVDIESPARDPAGIAEMADCSVRALSDLNLTIGITPGPNGPTVRIAMGPDRPSERQILILCHLDTVYPRGSLAEWPFRVEGDEVHGPGVYDMKGGLVEAIYTMRLLASAGLKFSRPIVLLLTPDEEVGSVASRPALEREALKSICVLIPEPSIGTKGGMKTSRSGRAQYTVRVKGLSSHAGLDPQGGASAIRELALQIGHIYQAAQPEHGCYINVGLIRGGTGVNVLAEQAEAVIDVRLAKQDQFATIDAAMRNLTPNDARTRLEIEGGIERPAWFVQPDGGMLVELAKDIGRELGLLIEDGHSGGGSDGNFTAALNIPTLDGLGPIGSGAHSRGKERILLSSLVWRAAWIAAVIEKVDANAGELMAMIKARK